MRCVAQMLAATSVAALVLLNGVGMVGAEPLVLGSTVIRGPEGSQVELARFPLPSPSATWTLTVTNQESVHPDTSLIVTSEAGSAVLADVESTPGAVTSASGVAAGGELVILVRLGPDGVFSGGLAAELAIAPVIVEDASTTTTAPPTTAPPTTEPPTTVPPTTAAPATPPSSAVPSSITPPTTALTTVPPPTVEPTQVEAPTTVVRSSEPPRVESLPVTGRSSAVSAAVGAALVATGLLFRRSARHALQPATVPARRRR